MLEVKLPYGHYPPRALSTGPLVMSVVRLEWTMHEAATAERAFNLGTITDRMYLKKEVKDGMG